ncbi:MAG: sigma-54-dependent Fis family transcriptional regulator [Thermoanaerobaculia bacterium]
MAERIDNRRSTPDLTSLLEVLPDPAMVIDREMKVQATNRRFRATFTDGGEVRGRLCYEVSHCLTQQCDPIRVTCPLERCVETEAPVRALHIHRTSEGEVHTDVLMRPLPTVLGETDRFLEILRPLHIASATANREKLVGRSRPFNRMLQDMERVGPTEQPVTIIGEPGTGKELVAKAIHELSPRSAGPFVPVDCSSLNEWQFERELFGFAKGAFPGAGEARAGLIGAADGGTLFLDEIDELPRSLQVKILRLVETRFYRPEGSNRHLRADFRLVCSATTDPKALVDAGAFRGDLWLALGSLPIRVPPLRDRPEDLPLLVESMLQRLSCLRRCRDLDPATLERLQVYRFPGNVRELISILERACLVAEGNVILPEHLPPDCRASGDLSSPELEFEGDVVPLGEAEVLYIDWAAKRTVGSQRALSRRLGISERTLYRKLRKVRNAHPGQQSEPAEVDPSIE